ncbi:class I SAM-dependent methyltransferase [Herpetosiphon giganteus]|uniref:class I SAM-dependent methyltransferase n=1 Tax=Herpetosiphon giganteus TaxID=2029754 RepID=UPI00195B2A87|nr:class I SAM-dependent methyltransferase [Herpetosiphon giganteus]MBM7842982.1 protein-L-isoaspartate O-methyltransferase [Herpetosiphon giganteus]
MNNNDWYRYFAPRQVATLSAERQQADYAAAQQDLDFVLGQLGLESNASILEIGCGWGRHSVALAERGFAHVLSIDIAPELLQAAQAFAQQHGQNCQFHQQDFIEINDQPFDAIFSLYDRSCCGYPSEAADAQSLQHLANLLQPNGWLIFGINDWPFALPEASQRWAETEQGLELYEVIPDRSAMTCTDRLTVLNAGQRTSYELTRRHYYLPELQRLLNNAGLRLASAWHRLDQNRAYGDGSNGLFIIAQRASNG